MYERRITLHCFLFRQMKDVAQTKARCRHAIAETSGNKKGQDVYPDLFYSNLG